MIGCYITGIFPRLTELVEITRAYTRGRIDASYLEKAFEDATSKIVDAQVSAEFDYVTDGMLRWQDMLRPFLKGLDGVKKGSLARWFNNNVFYRRPIIVDAIRRKRSIFEEATYIGHLPKNFYWKAILPAPNTFAQLSENQFYKNKTELMFKYAEILKEEIKSLTKLGFQYVQLSDPALVYEPIATSISRIESDCISEALRIAVEGTSIKTCVQTFFGDFCQILPEAIDFPVDHLGIDLYETDFEKLKEYSFEKGVALGLIDSRNSLVEDPNELAKVTKELVESIYPSKMGEVLVCPNCDLEFLPWERAHEKMEVIHNVTNRLREEF